MDSVSGRFEDAGGVMTGLGAREFGDDTILLQIGAFRLRTDLYQDLLPDPG